MTNGQQIGCSDTYSWAISPEIVYSVDLIWCIMHVTCYYFLMCITNPFDYSSNGTLVTEIFLIYRIRPTLQTKSHNKDFVHTIDEIQKHVSMYPDWIPSKHNVVVIQVGKRFASNLYVVFHPSSYLLFDMEALEVISIF